MSKITVDLREKRRLMQRRRQRLEQIVELLSQKTLTQAELAEKLGVTVAMISFDLRLLGLREYYHSLQQGGEPQNIALILPALEQGISLEETDERIVVDVSRFSYSRREGVSALVRLFNQGLFFSLNELAQELGMTISSLHEVLKKSGLHQFWSAGRDGKVLKPLLLVGYTPQRNISPQRKISLPTHPYLLEETKSWALPPKIPQLARWAEEPLPSLRRSLLKSGLFGVYAGRSGVSRLEDLRKTLAETYRQAQALIEDVATRGSPDLSVPKALEDRIAALQSWMEMVGGGSSMLPYEEPSQEALVADAPPSECTDLPSSEPVIAKPQPIVASDPQPVVADLLVADAPPSEFTDLPSSEPVIAKPQPIVASDLQPVVADPEPITETSSLETKLAETTQPVRKRRKKPADSVKPPVRRKKPAARPVRESLTYQEEGPSLPEPSRTFTPIYLPFRQQEKPLNERVKELFILLHVQLLRRVGAVPDFAVPLLKRIYEEDTSQLRDVHQAVGMADKQGEVIRLVQKRLEDKGYASLHRAALVFREETTKALQQNRHGDLTTLLDLNALLRPYRHDDARPISTSYNGRTYRVVSDCNPQTKKPRSETLESMSDEEFLRVSTSHLEGDEYKRVLPVVRGAADGDSLEDVAQFCELSPPQVDELARKVNIPGFAVSDYESLREIAQVLVGDSKPPDTKP